MKRWLAIAAFIIAPFSAHAFTTLAWPLDCTLGTDCFIQNYVDHGGGNDFACNPTSFTGLSGTDIRIRSLAAMRAGVTVRASAAGTVVGIHDGMDDVAATSGTMPGGKDCGNGVHIDSGDGDHIQYCHLRKGSVRVRVGQQVDMGDALGLVGLSGETQFPHLHINVMHGNPPQPQHLDPFTGGLASDACDATLATRAHQLWAKPVAYATTVLLNDGFASTRPDRAALLDTPTTLTTLSTTQTLAYWAELLNLRAGDIYDISIIDPNGKVVIGHEHRMEKPMPTHFDFVGRDQHKGPLAAGVYQGRIQILRDGKAIVDVTRSVTVQ